MVFMQSVGWMCSWAAFVMDATVRVTMPRACLIFGHIRKCLCARSWCSVGERLLHRPPPTVWMCQWVLTNGRKGISNHSSWCERDGDIRFIPSCRWLQRPLVHLRSVWRTEHFSYFNIFQFPLIVPRCNSGTGSLKGPEVGKGTSKIWATI